MGGLGSGGARRVKTERERELHGSRKRAYQHAEPKYGVHLPEAPAWLDEVGRQAWRYYGALLVSSSVMTDADRETLAGLCECISNISDIKAQQRAPEYRRVMLKVNMFVEKDGAATEHVEAKTNPLDAQLRQWLQLKRAYEADLGLSPASRARIKPVGAEREVDPFDEWERGRVQ